MYVFNVKKFLQINWHVCSANKGQNKGLIFCFSSVQFSCSVVSDSLQPHELQHARPSCPSPTSRVYPNSCPLSWWCHPTISSSVVPFSSHPQSFPASGSFQMSQLFAICCFSLLLLLFWLRWVFVALHRLFSSYGEWGLLFVEVYRLFIAVAFSCCWVKAPGEWDSVVAAYGLSCSAAYGIFPDQGLNPHPLHWTGGFLSTEPPGKSSVSGLMGIYNPQWVQCWGSHLGWLLWEKQGKLILLHPPREWIQPTLLFPQLHQHILS